MRVLLARPPSLSARQGLAAPPLGLAYVAAALRQAGHAVRLLDARGLGLGWPEYLRIIRTLQVDILGLTVFSSLLGEVARTVEASNARWTLVGGPHPSAVGERVFRDLSGVDLAVVGEGEVAAVAAVHWLGAGARGQPPAGVLFPGRPFHGAPSPPDLAHIPRPARDLLPNHRYRYPLATHPRSATLISSRGCPHGCVFCDHSVMGRRWRGRTAEDVLGEVDALVAEQGIGYLIFFDDDFLHDRERVLRICRGLRRDHPGLEWKCEARVDQVDAPLLAAMRRAGCRLVAFGLESARDDTLARLGKGFTVRQAEEALRLCREAGIQTLAYVILGSPGETLRDGLATLRFCQRVGVDYAQFSSLAVLPGTRLASEGDRLPPSDTGRIGVGLNPLDTELQRQVATSLSAHRLHRLLKLAWLGFYLRPGPLLRLGVGFTTSRTWPDALRLGRDLLGWVRT